MTTTSPPRQKVDRDEVFLAKVPALESVDFDTALERVAAAKRAVHEEIAGYSLLVATKA